MSDKGRIFLIVVAAAVVLGGGAIWWAFQQITKTPQTFIVGQQFVDHLVAGEYEQAQDLMSAEFQDESDLAAIEAIVQNQPELFTSETVLNLTGRGFWNELRYAYGTIEAGDADSPVYMEFVDEGGATKLSYMSFDEEDIPVNGEQQMPKAYIVGEAFIEALARKDIDAAIALSIPEFQTPEALASMEAFVEGEAEFFNDATEVTFTDKGRDGDLRYAYGTIDADGALTPVYMEFMDTEDGEPQVSFITLNEEDIPEYVNR